MYDPKQQSQEEKPKVRQLFPPAKEPVVVPTFPPQRWQAAIGAGTAPFADRDRIQEMLKQLGAFLAERRASVRFSTHTGLVRSLRGELHPDRAATAPQDMPGIAEEFLTQHGAALHGASEGYQWHSQSIVGPCAHLRQTDRSEIPVYGGTMVFHFSHRGQLDLVANSWYPIASDAQYLPRFQLDWSEAQSIAMDHVISHFPSRPQSQISSSLQTPPPDKGYPDLEAIPGDDLQEGRVVFPWLDQEIAEEGGQYRPAFIVWVNERNSPRSWEVAVDAEDGKVLSMLQASAEVVVQGCIYPSNEDVVKDNPPTTVDLADVENGEFAAKAPNFAMQGDAYQKPSACSGANRTGNNRMRTANVYYHLRHTLNTFNTGIAGAAWSGAIDAKVTMPGIEERIDVYMHPGYETSCYKHIDKSLHFGIGQPNSHVEDPAYDCEVAYHEYAHAVFHEVQPDIFKGLPYLFRHSLNEGIAFYYGCTVSERPPGAQPGAAPETSPSLWGEVAYGHQTWSGFRALQRERPEDQDPNFDWLQVYGVFPSYEQGTNDPNGGKYACGMVWARALWDIRRALGYQIADTVILRSLALLGGVQSELETAGEAVIQADGDYAQITEGPNHESALRLVFCSRGIAADSPVHDLVTIQLGGKTYVLAATENTAQGDDQPGCLISANQGDAWAPLGSDGPPEVTALAAVESGTKVFIWAAGEAWSQAGDGATATGKIYQYELGLDGNANPILDSSWDELDDLPKKVNILSLAGMKKPGGSNDEFWLFAGTEQGLYKYDGSWTLAGTMAEDRQVFDLAITEVPVNGQLTPRLLVATQSGVYVFDPDSLQRDTELEKDRPRGYVLTVAADGAQGHLWAGTAFDGIHHFDPGEGSWKNDSTIGANRPVHRLWVEQAGMQRTIYAGTNNGLYRRQGGAAWEAYNETSHPNGEAIQATSAVTLSRVGDRLLAGTAQRGVWGRKVSDGTGWTRLTAGLPRVGRLIDAQVPPGTSNWTGSFTNSLKAANNVGTHVLYVPNDDWGQLSVSTSDNVELALYYVAPYIDRDKDYGAGLQTRRLDGQGKMIESAKGGFYLLVVTAASDISYRIDVELR